MNKKLNDFFEECTEKKLLDKENIQLYFSSLSIDKQQEILSSIDQTQYLTNNNGVLEFAEEEEYLGQLQGSMPDSGESSVTFVDMMGGSVNYTVIVKGEDLDKKYYWKNEDGKEIELTETSPGSGIYQYTISAKESFFEMMHHEYLEYQKENLDIEELIELKNVDAILERFDEVPEEKYTKLLKCNYFEEGGEGLGNKYGTFFHKAATKLDLDQLITIVDYCMVNLDFAELHEYLMLVNQDGQTIFDLNLDKEKKEILQVLKSWLEESTQNLNLLDGGINTHTASIHASVDESLVKLATTLIGDHISPGDDARSIKLTRDHTLNNLIDTRIEKIHSTLSSITSYSDEELFGYLKPTLLKSEQDLDHTDPEIKKQLDGFRFQAAKALALMNDVKLRGNTGDYYDVNVNAVNNCGLTFKEILALTDMAIEDEQNLEYADKDLSAAQKLQHKRGLEINFIRNLYQMRRGYNIDHGEDDPFSHEYSRHTVDKNICPGGSINKMIDTLNGVHKDVEIKVITAGIMQAQISAKIKDIVDEIDIPEEKKGLLLFQWKNGGIMSQELQDVVMKHIMERGSSEMTLELRKNLNDYFTIHKQREIISQACANTKFPPALLASLEDYDLFTLLGASGSEIDNLPRFILTSTGYKNIFQYLAETDRDRFDAMMYAFITNASEQKLLDKSDDFIEYLNPSQIQDLYKTCPRIIHHLIKIGNIRGIKKFVEQGEGLDTEITQYKNYAHSTISLYEWAIENNHSEIAELILAKGPQPSMDQDLINAAISGHKQTVNLLIINGANVNAVDSTVPHSYPNNFDSYRNTPLMLAAKNNHPKVADKLIEFGADINLKNSQGQSALSIALSHESADIVRKLIDIGADIDISIEKELFIFAIKQGWVDVVDQYIDLELDYPRDTPLMLAAESGHENIVQKFIEKHNNLDAIGYHGNTALIIAIENDNTAAANKLIEANADLNIVGRSSRNTALMLAIEKGNTEVANKLIEANADLNIVDSIGNSALMLAIKKGNTEVANKLIEANADLNIIPYYDPNTALMLAIEKGNTEVANKLIEANADLNILDQNGNSLLILAIEKGNTEIANKLIEANIGLDVINHQQNTALMLAIENDNTEVANKLIEANANLNIVDRNGNSALMLAIEKGNTEVANKLIEANANLDVTNYQQNTALILAIEKHHTEIANKLIDKGANTDIVDINNYTTLMFAIYGEMELAKKLIDDHGADINAQNKDGNTALILAIQSYNFEIARYLISKGADVNIINNKGESALKSAIGSYTTKEDIIDSLIEKTGGIETKDANGETPLMLAVRSGNETLVKKLIANGADVNVQNQNGETALMLLAKLSPFLYNIREKNAIIANTLIKAGANANIKNFEGQSPLEVAIHSNNFTLARNLIDAGAIVTEKNSKGDIPLVHYFDVSYYAQRYRKDSTLAYKLLSTEYVMHFDNSIKRIEEVGNLINPLTDITAKMKIDLKRGNVSHYTNHELFTLYSNLDALLDSEINVVAKGCITELKTTLEQIHTAKNASIGQRIDDNSPFGELVHNHGNELISKMLKADSLREKFNMPKQKNTNHLSEEFMAKCSLSVQRQTLKVAEKFNSKTGSKRARCKDVLRRFFRALFFLRERHLDQKITDGLSQFKSELTTTPETEKKFANSFLEKISAARSNSESVVSARS